MKDHDILSRNPTGSGGIGLNAVLVDRSLGGLNTRQTQRYAQKEQTWTSCITKTAELEIVSQKSDAIREAMRRGVDEKWFQNLTCTGGVPGLPTETVFTGPNFEHSETYTWWVLRWHSRNADIEYLIHHEEYPGSQYIGSFYLKDHENHYHRPYRCNSPEEFENGATFEPHVAVMSGAPVST
jgi:hypothetical protein